MNPIESIAQPFTPADLAQLAEKIAAAPQNCLLWYWSPATRSVVVVWIVAGRVDGWEVVSPMTTAALAREYAEAVHAAANAAKNKLEEPPAAPPRPN